MLQPQEKYPRYLKAHRPPPKGPPGDRAAAPQANQGLARAHGIKVAFQFGSDQSARTTRKNGAGFRGVPVPRPAREVIERRALFRTVPHSGAHAAPYTLLSDFQTLSAESTEVNGSGFTARDVLPRASVRAR